MQIQNAGAFLPQKGLLATPPSQVVRGGVASNSFLLAAGRCLGQKFFIFFSSQAVIYFSSWNVWKIRLPGLLSVH